MVYTHQGIPGTPGRDGIDGTPGTNGRRGPKGETVSKHHLTYPCVLCIIVVSRVHQACLDVMVKMELRDGWAKKDQQ